MKSRNSWYFDLIPNQKISRFHSYSNRQSSAQSWPINGEDPITSIKKQKFTNRVISWEPSFNSLTVLFNLYTLFFSKYTMTINHSKFLHIISGFLANLLKIDKFKKNTFSFIRRYNWIIWKGCQFEWTKYRQITL